MPMLLMVLHGIFMLHIPGMVWFDVAFCAAVLFGPGWNAIRGAWGSVRAGSASMDVLIVLGVAGKMGPNLARMARRAADLGGSRRRVIGVARFSSASPRRSSWSRASFSACCWPE